MKTSSAALAFAAVLVLSSHAFADDTAPVRDHRASVRPSTTTLATSIVLLGLSAAFAAGGATVAIWGVVERDNFAAAILAPFISAPLFAGSLATGIPGTIMLANAWNTNASTVPAPRAFMVPVVSTSF